MKAIGMAVLASVLMFSCGGDCEIDAGAFDCALTVQNLIGTCGNLKAGQQVKWVYTVAANGNHECRSENVSIGPMWEAGSALWFWYDGNISGVSSTRLEGFFNYRFSPNRSGLPECKLGGPLVCIHR